MYTQDIIQPFLKVAQEYLDERRIQEIIFSRATYHIQLIDKTTQDPTWAFISLDPNNQVKDCFCSCQTQSALSCEHLAAAALRIFNGHYGPLHIRFKHSFWRQICHLFAQEYGYSQKILTQKDGQYTLKEGRNTLFSIQPLNAKATKTLYECIVEKKKETEETSLKFSNLPKKELELWKMGHPSDTFKFELSFWSDIAKWLMFLQEDKEPYQVKITPSQHLPNKISIVFQTVKVSFALPPVILKQIIPFLNTIDSPLKAHQSKTQEIAKILYNPSEKSLSIYPEKDRSDDPQDQSQGHPIGDWIYMHKQGFYHKLLGKTFPEKEKILSHQIDHHLEKNAPFFKKHLQNAELKLNPISPKYQVKFDDQWNLLIDLYLFEPKDLEKKHSVFFGKWVFLENRGFYRLYESAFLQPSLFIPKDQVSEFIHEHRSWLNTQKGFEVHLATVQTHMEYDVNANQQLVFASHLGAQDEHSFDFGDWVYVQSQGFYTKMRTSSPICNGLIVKKKDIGRFIHAHQEDLEQTPGFFSTKCPVKQATIHLSVQHEKQEIHLSPQYHFHPEYKEKKVELFDDFSYVKDEGFYPLPPHLTLPKGFQKKVRILPEDQAAFLAFQFKKLKEFISHIDPMLIEANDLHLELKQVSGKCIDLIYKSEFGTAKISEILHAHAKGYPFYFSKAGLISLNHPRFSWIFQLQKGQIQEDGLQLNPIDIIRIEAIDSAFCEHVAPQSLLAKINESVDLTLPKLNGFKASLRPYQQIGLEWLWKLSCYGLSGILCDDMGLGKTLQSMALINAIKNKQTKRPYAGFKAPKKKFLIVCPTSVIYHWQDKLQEFYPKMKILTFYGLNRSMKRFQQTFDIFLTSYGILRIDQKQISQINFSLAIYDEIQVAKNHRSLTYSALSNVSSKMKLGLTGTPIENHLRELKALMDLIVPSYMPLENNFRDFFINPIEKDKDTDKIKILKKMIEPFILRRKKEDVLKELPAKIEQTSHCELTPEQSNLYNLTINQSRQQILDDLKNSSKPIPYMHIFSLLTKLKQICNHPKTIDPIKYEKSSSGKWELFIELLQESRESGQKVVIFSQYLKMIDLIEDYLKQNQIGYASIRGSTKDRKAPLKRFKEDPKCEIFVGSLKAVGLGVDLTAASVVIHYDRWWNAARENQATDRVHRMGQQKGVQVFKMVTLNTLEEKIDQIIRSKGELMEEVVGSSESDHVKSFSREDLIEILQVVQKDIYTSS